MQTILYVHNQDSDTSNTSQHTTHHNTTHHNTTHLNTTQYNTTQHNTSQHNNTTQHITTHHNTSQKKYIHRIPCVFLIVGLRILDNGTWLLGGRDVWLLPATDISLSTLYREMINFCVNVTRNCKFVKCTSRTVVARSSISLISGQSQEKRKSPYQEFNEKVHV